jgi:hypothetical protein
VSAANGDDATGVKSVIHRNATLHDIVMTGSAT